MDLKKEINSKILDLDVDKYFIIPDPKRYD